MKECAYCGRESELGARICAGCGTDFSISMPDEIRTGSFSKRTGFDASVVDLDIRLCDGFSRPNWNRLALAVTHCVPQEDWDLAWNAIAEKWLGVLAEDLGGASVVHVSGNFLCLSDLEITGIQALVNYAESILEVVRAGFGGTNVGRGLGKFILLAFSDPDDYFTYISYYEPEGELVSSSGIFIPSGYPHIALPYIDSQAAEHVVLHELVHNLLYQLPIPLWLNEGLALFLEHRVLQRPFYLEEELVVRHSQHWTEETIQRFWAGASFQTPGEESELSYSLAQILVTLLSENSRNLLKFIECADWRDAGQDAALTILDMDLADLLSKFLGPGNWRPSRKIIASFLQPKASS